MDKEQTITSEELAKAKEILSLASKEQWRRKLSVASRIIAIFLILSICWIGFLQLKYAKEVYSIKDKYGSLGYCYLCGKEALRKCECEYYQFYDATNTYHPLNLTAYSEYLANESISPCPPLKGISGGIQYGLSPNLLRSLLVNSSNNIS